MLDPGSRAHALRDLLELRAGVPESLERLGHSELLPEYLHIVLVPSDVARVLERYLAGTMDDFGVSSWAETVHSFEDIVLEPASCDFLADALYQLSTPELFGTVSSIVESLRTACRQQNCSACPNPRNQKEPAPWGAGSFRSSKDSLKPATWCLPLGVGQNP